MFWGYNVQVISITLWDTQYSGALRGQYNLKSDFVGAIIIIMFNVL